MNSLLTKDVGLLLVAKQTEPKSNDTLEDTS